MQGHSRRGGGCQGSCCGRESQERRAPNRAPTARKRRGPAHLCTHFPACSREGDELMPAQQPATPCRASARCKCAEGGENNTHLARQAGHQLGRVDGVHTCTSGALHAGAPTRIKAHAGCKQRQRTAGAAWSGSCGDAGGGAASEASAWLAEAAGWCRGGAAACRCLLPSTEAGCLTSWSRGSEGAQREGTGRQQARAAAAERSGPAGAEHKPKGQVASGALPRQHGGPIYPAARQGQRRRGHTHESSLCRAPAVDANCCSWSSCRRCCSADGRAAWCRACACD